MQKQSDPIHPQPNQPNQPRQPQQPTQQQLVQRQSSCIPLRASETSRDVALHRLAREPLNSALAVMIASLAVEMFLIMYLTW